MCSKRTCLKLFIIWLYCFHSHAFDLPNQFNPDDFLKEPENLKSVSELVEPFGYQCEEHTVITQDGYILTIHRMLHPYDKTHKQAVLLQPGLFLSSSSWVLNGPNNSIACALVNAGYDVWLGNHRGNQYGREHIHINPTQSKFWNFSLDEMAKYDLPSIVDYVIRIKNEESSDRDEQIPTKHHTNILNKLFGQTQDVIHRQIRDTNKFQESIKNYLKSFYDLFGGKPTKTIDFIESNGEFNDTSEKNAIILVANYQGALLSMMHLSQDSAFASKIKLLIAYGMPREGAMLKVPLTRLLTKIDVNRYFENDVVLSNPDERFDLFKKLCDKRQDLIKSMFGEPIDFLYFIAGKNNFIDKNKLKEFLPYLFTGTSKNVMTHFAQIYRSGKARSFDSSMVESEEIHPEEYKFDQINVPFVVISGHKEPDNPAGGIFKLHSVPFLKRHVVIKNFGIYDFLIGENLSEDVIPVILDLLK